MALLRIILYVLIVIFALRIIGWLIIRFFLYKLRKNVDGYYKNQSQQTFSDGDVTITYRKTKQQKQNEGEYVDYEEI